MTTAVPVAVAGTAPYPWPFDGDLAPTRLALVVVGAQQWWVGRTDEPARHLAALAEAAQAVRSVGGVVVVVRHGRPPAVRGGARAAPRLPWRGTPGASLVVEVGTGDVVVDAGGFDAFFAGPLDAELRARGRDRLIVGGLGLESAVYSSLAGANDRGYECLALSDAAAPHGAVTGLAALSSITMSGGIFAAVGTSTALGEALARATSNEETP